MHGGNAMADETAANEGSGTVWLVTPLAAGRIAIGILAAAWVFFFHGFLAPALAALVVACASWPLYSRLRSRVGGDSAAAAVAIAFVIVFLVTPVVFSAYYASGEARQWVAWVARSNKTGIAPPDWLAGLPLAGEAVSAWWSENLGHPGAVGETLGLFGGANLQGIYRMALSVGGSMFGFLLSVVFMLFILFFLYRNGDAMRDQLRSVGEGILPGRWDRYSAVIPATVRSTVNGMTLIAIGEGFVLGVAYWIAGVPTPVTFGVLTGVMAMVPGGAPLSFTLVSAWLALSGSPMAGALLFSWGTVELFAVDKTIRPKLVGGPIKLPFLPTFFGLVGGVKTLGFLGLFVGPVVMALAFAAWKEWTAALARHRPGPPTPPRR